MGPPFIILAFCVGACLGSFINVLIYRLPRRLSIVSPRSFCPHCGHTVRWFDNAPILSFLVLRGKCRDCEGTISWRYPAVEFLTGVVVVLLFIFFF